MKILIAGIGNIFHCDDGFGCAVARELSRKIFSDEVTVKDFGIRGCDLAYALTDGFDAVILVDAILRGEEPGTIFLIEPDVDGLGGFENAVLGGHSMNPVAVIQMAQSLGDICGKLFLVGCEPEILDGENEMGEIGLTKKVQGAIPEAVELIESLVENLLGAKKQEPETAGFIPA